jgi:hypothetical protein
VTSRPFLLIDVDGVLNPFAGRRTKPAFSTHQLAGFTVRLNPAHGPMLMQFADRFDLVWATTWEDQANELIGPIVGLPTLPVIHLGFTSKDRLRHKWPAISAYVGDRPLVWIDDEPSSDDAGRVQSRNLHIPTRIVKTHPASGLLPEHTVLIERFYVRLAGKR